MRDANSWLMALSFLLGLLLTSAFIVRRVTGEAFVATPTTPMPARTAGTAHLAGGKLPSDAATAEMFVGDGPYGAGSVTAGAGGGGPAGWTIKGNEDSMLYHTLDSPWYGQTIAEVWFRDEKTAAAAGFTRWDIHEHQEK